MADEEIGWPEWWDWELELSPHLLKRMAERSFNEVDLRSMLSVATQWRISSTQGRFIISSRLLARDWEIVVEPDEAENLLIIITAYPKR
jgi:hypothetical protein